MAKRVSPIQASYPVPEDFVALARRWRPDAVELLFSIVWRAVDRLLERHHLDLKEADDNIERGLTQLVWLATDEIMDRSSPVTLIHHPFEDETRETPPASPPAPDLAFVWRENPRATLPLEAKLLRTDGAVADYVQEITANFLTARYGPFSSQGGMLGYLLAGLALQALANIAAKLDCELVQHPAFPDRDHRLSQHRRTAQACQHAPREFTCHHLIIYFGE